MTVLILQFAMLSVIILLAGTFLTRSADRIAELSGIGRSFAGFVLLAGATSLPELTIDCSAAYIHAADLALGDLLGSCLFNLLILGVIDLTHQRTVRILSPISAAHALSAATSIVLTAVLLLSILLPWSVAFMGVGLGSLAIGFVYVFSLRLIYFDQQASRSELVSEAEPTTPGASLRVSVSTFLLAALAILLFAPLLASIADALAEKSGLGGTFVGTTFVALTTSLPEIVTTLVAVRMGAYELAVGNVFGSNCFNLAIVPLVDAFYQPDPILSRVDSIHAATAAAVIVITGLAAMGILYRVEKKLWIIEPDALLVVLLVIGALVMVYFLSSAENRQDGVSESPTGRQLRPTLCGPDRRGPSRANLGHSVCVFAQANTPVA